MQNIISDTKQLKRQVAAREPTLNVQKTKYLIFSTEISCYKKAELIEASYKNSTLVVNHRHC